MAREMKDSGVEWIGKMPFTWELSKIGALYSQRNQKVSDKDFPPLSVTMKGIIPQIETAAKTDDGDNRKLVRKGDFAINSRSDRRGSCGISAYDGSVSLINSILTPRGKMHPDYYNWLFHTTLFADEFYKWGHGIVDDLWTTRWQEMKSIYVPVPPYCDQERISTFLSQQCAEIDAVLDKTRVSIEEYKKLKQAIITQAVTKGIHEGRPMRESGIEWAGTIPEEIKISRVGLHYDIILGKMLCSSQVDDSYTLEPYYCAADIHFEGISDDERKMMWFGPSERELYLVKEGDLLVVEGGAGAGGCAIVIDTGTPTYIQNSIMIVRPKNSRDCRYLRYLLECFVKQGYIDVVCNKATIPHFTKDKLGCVPYFVFSEKEKEEISDYLDEQCGRIDAIVKKKEQYLVEIEQYKNSLIYEFVTGKKEVPLEQEQYIQEIIVYPHFPAALQVKSPRFAQAVLMSKVLDECRTKMGRVKLEKMMFVLENSIGFDFDTEYVREAAGPLDKSIYACEGIISKKNKWYIITSPGRNVSYRPAKDQQKYKNYYEKYFGEHDAEIERIIGIFKDYSTDQAEIIATLYGAWNDFIIDKRSYTDNDIVDEVLTNWNDSKKRFSKDVWLRAIQKMKELALVPHGYGRHTVSKGGKGCG